ncbi:tetratricopeptide repeat protein [Tissierella creatinophila]|uniref:Photosystem I assembly protein Ycf3 n=1 Tax=Tissierella creatinophila DSM 6911 TaxID=1123403 RepID=A0A1U7M6E0_TISCR|nr:hypothetical protein [Tissierella creatinophila]OLS02820.1 photosystem I assembly protein Ycf3 [Tissierella creatinophila DSM 6911]
MDYIAKMLKKKTEDLSFIQIKNNAQLKDKVYDMVDIPLPILTNSLIQAVKGRDDQEIDLSKVIDGIIYLLGIGDADFPYIDKYKILIRKISPEIEEVILFKAMDSFKEGDIESNLISIRALLSLNPDHVKALFQYAIVLETIGKSLLEKEDIDGGEEVLRLSTLNFERILDIDKEYSLAYYKLGYHYRYLSQYIKTDLIWGKFLKFSSDELLKEEIREELDVIKDEVNFETAISYISYSDYKKALDFILKLLPNHEESWNVNYLIGKCYNGLGQTESAIEYFNAAIKYNVEESDLYNDLGVLYYNIGEIYNAITTFTEGLKYNQEDYKLIFNRSLMYSVLEEYEKALEDAKRAYELNPDNSIAEQIKWLEEQI